MQAQLTKHPKDIAKMTDSEFRSWLADVDSDMRENPDRKGPVTYLVKDTMDAGAAIAGRVQDAVDAYNGWREAEAQADKAEAAAKEMEARVAAKKAELGRT